MPWICRVKWEWAPVSVGSEFEVTIWSGLLLSNGEWPKRFSSMLETHSNWPSTKARKDAGVFTDDPEIYVTIVRHQNFVANISLTKLLERYLVSKCERRRHRPNLRQYPNMDWWDRNIRCKLVHHYQWRPLCHNMKNHRLDCPFQNAQKGHFLTKMADSRNQGPETVRFRDRTRVGRNRFLRVASGS